jgi:hypothetical protein
MKSSFHGLIPFLPLFCNCQLRRLYLIQFLCSQARGCVSKLDLVLLIWTLLYSHFARTTQKTETLCCLEGLFIAPLHGNGSYSIVACIFIAVGVYLPTRCLAMNVYSDFSISASGRHVTLMQRSVWGSKGLDMSLVWERVEMHKPRRD